MTEGRRGFFARLEDQLPYFCWLTGILGVISVATVVFALWPWPVARLMGIANDKDPTKVPLLVLEFGTKVFVAFSFVFTIYVTLERIVKAQANLDLARNSQVHSRISNAVELLGSTYGKDGSEPRTEARVGAVLLLEDIAMGRSEFAALARRVLLEYVRLQAAREHAHERPDLSLALRSLFRCARESPPEQRISLDGLHFEHLCLGEDWTSDDLSWPQVDLTNTHFGGAKLGRADMTRATLNGTTFDENAQLRGASFPRMVVACSFEKADLTGASFDGTAFIGQCNLKGAILRQVKMHGTTFQGDDKMEVQPGERAPTACGIHYPDLTEADFEGATLKSVNFDKADLRLTKWCGAIMDGATEESLKLALREGEKESLRPVSTEVRPPAKPLFPPTLGKQNG